MFNFIRNLYEKSQPLNTDNNFHPLMLNKALSMHRANLKICDAMNRYSFYIPKDLWQMIVFLSIPQQRQPWDKYVKKKKAEEEKIDFYYAALMKYFNWSGRELRQNLPCIDEEMKKTLARKFGFSKTECKLLGVEFLTPEKPKKRAAANLESFGL